MTIDKEKYELARDLFRDLIGDIINILEKSYGKEITDMLCNDYLIPEDPNTDCDCEYCKQLHELKANHEKERDKFEADFAQYLDKVVNIINKLADSK